MLYMDEGKLDLPEIKVTGANEVEGLVQEGWRVLAVLYATTPNAHPQNVAWYDQNGQHNSAHLNMPGQAVFTPQFIMGRSEKGAKLYHRVLDAETALDEALEHGKQLVQELNIATGRIESMETSIDKHVADNSDLSRKLLGVEVQLEAIQLERDMVRRELGEGKWREILHAIEVEKGMEQGDDGEGDDVPF